MKVEFRKFFASAVKIAGIGYVVVPGMIVFAILFLYFDRCGLLFRLEFSSAATAVRIISAAVAVVSAVMWFIAGFRSRLIESVMKDQLVTTGIYAWVRNPLYVAGTGCGLRCWSAAPRKKYLQLNSEKFMRSTAAE